MCFYFVIVFSCFINGKRKINDKMPIVKLVFTDSVTFNKKVITNNLENVLNKVGNIFLFLVDY
jgi:hypothetical protein